MRYSQTDRPEEKINLEMGEADETARRSTLKLCRYISETDPPCYGPYRWHLSGDSGSYVVCDAHLAMAIRSCDLPARIDRPRSSEDVLSVRFVSKRNPLSKP